MKTVSGLSWPLCAIAVVLACSLESPASHQKGAAIAGNALTSSAFVEAYSPPPVEPRPATADGVGEKRTSLLAGSQSTDPQHVYPAPLDQFDLNVLHRASVPPYKLQNGQRPDEAVWLGAQPAATTTAEEMPELGKSSGVAGPIRTMRPTEMRRAPYSMSDIHEARTHSRRTSATATGSLLALPPRNLHMGQAPPLRRIPSSSPDVPVPSPVPATPRTAFIKDPLAAAHFQDLAKAFGRAKEVEQMKAQAERDAVAAQALAPSVSSTDFGPDAAYAPDHPLFQVHSLQPPLINPLLPVPSSQLQSDIATSLDQTLPIHLQQIPLSSHQVDQLLPAQLQPAVPILQPQAHSSDESAALELHPILQDMPEVHPDHLVHLQAPQVDQMFSLPPPQPESAMQPLPLAPSSFDSHMIPVQQTQPLQAPSMPAPLPLANLTPLEQSYPAPDGGSPPPDSYFWPQPRQPSPQLEPVHLLPMQPRHVSSDMEVVLPAQLSTEAASEAASRPSTAMTEPVQQPNVSKAFESSLTEARPELSRPSEAPSQTSTENSREQAPWPSVLAMPPAGSGEAQVADEPENNYVTDSTSSGVFEPSDRASATMMSVSESSQHFPTFATDSSTDNEPTRRTLHCPACKCKVATEEGRLVHYSKYHVNLPHGGNCPICFKKYSIIDHIMPHFKDCTKRLLKATLKMDSKYDDIFPTAEAPDAASASSSSCDLGITCTFHVPMKVVDVMHAVRAMALPNAKENSEEVAKAVEMLSAIKSPQLMRMIETTISRLPEAREPCPLCNASQKTVVDMAQHIERHLVDLQRAGDEKGRRIAAKRFVMSDRYRPTRSM